MAYFIRYGPVYLSPKVDTIEGDEQRFEDLKRAIVPFRPNGTFVGKLTAPWTGDKWPTYDEPLRNIALTRPKKIKDFVCSSFGYVVSDHFIEVLEAVDPGINAYLPFQFIAKTGEPLPEKRSLLNVTSALDTIDVERSAENIVDSRSGRVGVAGGPCHIRMDKARIAGRAIWYEWRFVYAGLVISDQFHQELKKARITGWAIDRWKGWDGHVPEI